jgi:hypothetical protein
LAAPPRPFGLRSTAGQGDWAAELAIAHDAPYEPPIAAGHGAVALAAPPPAPATEVSAGCSADRLRDAPSPLPATLGRSTCVLGMAPNGHEPLKAQAPQAFEPGSLGPSASELSRARRVPSAHTGEFMPLSAAQAGGTPPADDGAPELLVSPPAACALSHSGLGEAQGLEGLRDGLTRAWGRGALWPEACLGFEPTAFDGLGWSLGVSVHGGHGALLRTRLVFLLGAKEPRSHLRRI